MKVLMLGWELPPHNSGGLGEACYRLCKALASQGADIDFIIPHKAKYKNDFMRVSSASYRKGSGKVENYFNAYDSYKYIDDFGHEEWVNIFTQEKEYEDGIGRIVDKMDFDIIHAHDWLTFRAALKAKQISGKPLIVHIHSLERDRAGGGDGNPMIREIEATVMGIADRIIAVSQKTKNEIVEDYGIPADKIDIVRNSIDMSDLEIDQEVENAYKFLTKMKSKGSRVVVNVGRFTIQKNLPNLLRAAKEVIYRAPNTYFLLVGDGEQMFELIDLAASLGISKNVIFTGFQRGKNLRDAFKIADLFVMPSVSEPFGLTPLEAIGYGGTPSLVSYQSGVIEVLNNCLKVDYWDVNEMANQITSIVQNESLGEELRKNAYKEYEKLSWSKSASEVMDLYNKRLELATV
jgi:glycogen(starch) synthase